MGRCVSELSGTGGFDTIDMNILMGDTAAFMSAYILLGLMGIREKEDECTDLLGMLRAMHIKV